MYVFACRSTEFVSVVEITWLFERGTAGFRAIGRSLDIRFGETSWRDWNSYMERELNRIQEDPLRKVCEICVFIWYLWNEKLQLRFSIRTKFFMVYESYKSSRNFKTGWSSMHGDQRSGRPQNCDSRTCKKKIRMRFVMIASVWSDVTL